MPTIQNPHNSNGRAPTNGVRDDVDMKAKHEKSREAVQHGAVAGKVNEAKNSTHLKERQLPQDSDRTPID